jgi:hypothetical protein
MAEFMLVYRGEATDLSAMTPEEGKAVLDKWQAWMGKVGSALKDVGAPFGESTSLVDKWQGPGRHRVVGLFDH